jgi:lysophospholipase L1-like esterase
MGMTVLLPHRFLLLLALLVAVAAPALAQPLSCPPAPASPFPSLRHLRAALEHGNEALVVAIGSSSTEGVMASDPAHSYPARLQAALERALPSTHVAVINRGIGGQDAPEELARLQADVIAVRPQLVIWQVGANGALRNADPNQFRLMVSEGVSRLEAAGIDVILMDNQHSPRVDAAPEHGVLDAVLAQVAEATGAGLFSRARLMNAWTREGTPSLEFVASDGLHHNDRGYACVANALADAIVARLHETRTLAASR